MRMAARLILLSVLCCSSFSWAEVAPAEVGGTGVATPSYDPAHGGWDSEQLADAASARLDVLKHALEAGTMDGVKLGNLTSPTFRGDGLRPKVVKEVFADEVVMVNRSGRDGSLSFRGPEGLLGSARHLLETLQAGPLHAKFKTVGVDVSGAKVTTRAEIRLDGSSSRQERLQVNAVWTCVWKRSGEALQLESLVVEDYEEVLTKEARNQPFFADGTAGVLGGDPSFSKQLAYGLDHWLARMDSRAGAKVGGWNGLAIGDANGDGLEDLYVCQKGGLPNRLFLARPDGTAGDVAAAAGVDWLETSRGALFVDLDNDGDQDLVVAVEEGLVIQENDGSGRFTVKSAEVLPFAVPYSLAAADFDTDGDLDIFAACYDRRGHVDRNVSLARPVPYQDARNGGRNALLRNDGQFRFRQVTKRVGLDENNSRYSYAATWADFNQDGYLDLYVANDFGGNNLYQQKRSQGQIQFVDVAEKAGVLDIAAGMSAAWGDYDNDGWFDLYVSNMFSSAGNRIAKQGRFLKGKDKATRDLFVRHARGNSLFRNQKSSTGLNAFADVSVEAAVTQGRWAWGSAFADLNNDGWQDIVVANGFITQEDTGDL